MVTITTDGSEAITQDSVAKALGDDAQHFAVRSWSQKADIEAKLDKGETEVKK